MNVPMVRWPNNAAEVERYRSLGVPRLLILEDAARPPVCADPLEDWVRTPIAADDLRARSDALLARAEADIPVLDKKGVLHVGGPDCRWRPARRMSYACWCNRSGWWWTARTWPGRYGPAGPVSGAMRWTSEFCESAAGSNRAAW